MPTKKKTPMFSILDYLASGNDKDRFDFNSSDEAYIFANKLREVIKKEGHHGVITVEARNSAVFVTVAHTAVYVGS